MQAPPSPFSTTKIRSLFPYFRNEHNPIYLDTAATAQKPDAVIDAITNFYKQDYATVHRAVYTKAAKATELYYLAREAVASFIHAKESNEILFTKGTTESLNLIASSFARSLLSDGDEILICETEHHANIVPWQQVAREKGARLVVLPIQEDGSVLIEDVRKSLSSKTKLVCMAHISNVTGTVHPIKEIAALVHKQHGYIIVDGAQSVAHLHVDVQDLDCDFFAFSGHKVYGPTGVGVLYAKKEHLEKMVPYQFGGDMIELVTFENTTFKPAPYRFEAGTPMIAEVIGLHAAIDFINQIGIANIEEHEKKLLAYAQDHIRQIPDLEFYGTTPNKGGILSFNVLGAHHLDVGTLLDSKGVAVRTGHLCAQPAMKRFKVNGMVRASFGLYNDFQDIDFFIKALQKSVLLLK